MQSLTLDAARWRTAGDVYDALLVALGAPTWHGRNLDALADSLRGGDLNRVNSPLDVTVTGLSSAGPEAQAAATRIAVLFADLSHDGCDVRWRDA